MKVSSNNEILKIYREQVSKVRGEGSGEAFKKIMQETVSTGDGPAKSRFHPPSGVNLTNPVFQGKPVKEADPAKTMQFAAEVVANQPEIREDKVERLRALIKSGQYNVSPEAVAERMLTHQDGGRYLTTSWED